MVKQATKMIQRLKYFQEAKPSIKPETSKRQTKEEDQEKRE
jgi:hypothetical protein